MEGGREGGEQKEGWRREMKEGWRREKGRE